MGLINTLLIIGLTAVLQTCFVNGNTCQFTVGNCDNVNFYALNGTCNNLNKTAAGSKDSPLGRTISYIPTGGTGNIPFTNFLQIKLPQPREVSAKMFLCDNITEMNATHLFANFGKLLMYDMFHIKRNTTDSACSSSSLGLEVSEADPRTVKFNCSNKCMKYNKPILTEDLSCQGNAVNGINLFTHVLDASYLFDNDDLIKSFTESNGKINLTSGFLPILNGTFQGVSSPIKESPLVMALYHVFLREYNRLVDKMVVFNATTPSTEAKKLLIALFQHITYNEFLPKLLGADTSVKAMANGTRNYTDANKPIISHTTVVVFKLLVASMLRDKFEIAPNTTEDITNVLNDATFLNSETKMVDIVNGMLKDNSLDIDSKIPCALRHNCNYTDIVSTLIQDSRVYGIPPYVVFLALKNQTSVNSVNDFPYHGSDEKQALQNMYGFYYGIDMLTGLFTEMKHTGSNVGTLIKEVLELQFKKLRDGDRFFYDNENVFESHQLDIIRNETMARLLCRNVNLTSVKTEAFDSNSAHVTCKDTPDIDFCKYFNISTDWNEYQYVSGVPCVLLRVAIRTCKSTLPSECKCEGEPFKVESCPNQLLTFEFKNVLASINKKMTHDNKNYRYAREGNILELEKRAKALFYKFYG